MRNGQPGLPHLYVALLAAVLQGWTLYALHVALRDDLQITDWSMFPAFYVLAVFAPLTVQLLATHSRQRLMWLMVLTLSAVFFALAWHQAALVQKATPRWFETDAGAPVGLALALLWLHLTPFMQARLASGYWRPRYPQLFAASWRNVLVLFEAVVFTLALWLLLFLWAQLFEMLDIHFFRELFRMPVFAYPVSALAFGLAIHLIGSVERIVEVLLEQVLSLFKWLGLVAGVILVFFTIALLTRLPTLVETETRAIGAHWLLWLVAITVLLLNAAYRDGKNIQPYPRLAGNALRWTVPLLVPVALTALYSLVLRADNYGLTVQRVWAFVVAIIALAYALGYSIAAVRRGPWLASIGSTNVAVALAFIVLMLLFLTPALSPQRLTASSQYARVLDAPDERAANEALRTLRFDAGEYGRRRLSLLTQLVEHPRADAIRAAASRVLAQRYPEPRPALAAAIDELIVFPAGRKLDGPLRDTLRGLLGVCMNGRRCVGLFADVDGVPGEEFVLLSPAISQVLRAAGGAWTMVPANYAGVGEGRWDAALAALERGDFGTQASQWQDLRIGALRLTPVGTASEAR